MMHRKEIKGPPISLPQQPRWWPALVTSTAGLCVAVALGAYLWSEIAATFDQLFSPSNAAAEAVASNALPVDAPAVSVARAHNQEVEANTAAAAATEVVLKDWNYTQFSFSPFSFGQDNFDFFNPLFAFDFPNSQNQNSSLISSLLNGPFSTPFGFNLASGTGMPFVIGGSSTGGSMFVTDPPGSQTTTTTQNVTIPFLNGSSILASITVSITFNTQSLGGAGFSHRHFGGETIIINITFIVVSPVK
jgi:hypothetical protein